MQCPSLCLQWSAGDDLKLASLKPRRWTVIASGLLCGVLGLVVLFTNRRAFFSPLAVVVVAAIGFAAVLLQVRFSNQQEERSVHPPVWLNVLGAVLALVALFSDVLRLSEQVAQLVSLGAVGIFGIGGALVLHGFRRHRVPQNNSAGLPKV